jgi:hypothetical protein
MNFIMPRDRIVASKFGRSFQFVKGEPLHVPDMCWEEVQAAGAVPESELPVDENAVPPAPQGAERAKAISDAIKKMVLKGERNDFTGSGAPNAAVLSSITGFMVDAKERDLAWAAAQTE